MKADPADQSAYLHDWVTARGRLWTLVSLKLAYWSQLPWKLCALEELVSCIIIFAQTDSDSHGDNRQF